MAKRPTEQLYEVTRYQQIIWVQEKYSIFKNISNIPFVVTFKKKLDFNILQKAVETEIQRNDALRVFGYKEKKQTYQYFKESVDIGKIPYVSFAGKTKEEQDKYFQKVSNKPINYCKNLSYKFIFMTDYEGKDGFYFVQNHLLNDTGGILIMINDLMHVYSHLKDGTEMPRQLSSFREMVIKQNEALQNQAKVEADRAFFDDYYKNCGPMCYMAPYKDENLNKYRAKKKNPQLRAAPAVAMYDGKTRLARMEFTGAEYEKIMKCCQDCKTSVQNFFYMLLRFQCYLSSGIKEGMENPMTSGNRATLSEKRCSGMMLNNFCPVTPYEGEKVLSDKFGEFQAMLNNMYKYKTIGGIQSMSYLDKYHPHGPMEGFSSGTVSVVPAMFDFPGDMGIMISWLPPQTLPSPTFHVIVHDMMNDRVQYNFQYSPKFVKDDQVEPMFESMRALAMVMAEHPDWTEDQITGACRY